MPPTLESGSGYAPLLWKVGMAMPPYFGKWEWLYMTPYSADFHVSPPLYSKVQCDLKLKLCPFMSPMAKCFWKLHGDSTKAF